jgi:NADH-quinone oxidoreductase subunit H
VYFLTGLNSPLWGFVGNVLALGYFALKVYGLCFVFVWIRTTLPRLRADQLMQYAWLILMPVTLGNIIVVALLYFMLSWAPVWVYLVVLGTVNWLALVGFIFLIRRITTITTRRAQAPAIRAQLRTKPSQPAPASLPLRDAIPARVEPLPQSVGATGSRE